MPYPPISEAKLKTYPIINPLNIAVKTGNIPKKTPKNANNQRGKIPIIFKSRRNRRNKEHKNDNNQRA